MFSNSILLGNGMTFGKEVTLGSPPFFETTADSRDLFENFFMCL